MVEKESSNMLQQIRERLTQAPVRLRSYHVIRTLLIGFIFVSVSSALFSYIFYTPKAHRIYLDNMELVSRYNLLENKIEAAHDRLAAIAYRDNNVYRPLFALDTLPLNSTTQPYPNSTYEWLEGDTYTPQMRSAWEKMDILAKDIYRQSLSLDELQLLAKDREFFSASIPAVWPIDRTTLKYGVGAFGMRTHPIYKRRAMHKGIDLPCDTGNPIYATADGIVERSEQGLRRSGYGQMVLLQHKFGYQTRYAHMSERLVAQGDTVRRGDVIGLIGSTGASTGPHLHYEVIVRGEVVNPLNFFNRDMSKEEYQRLMEQVQETKFDIF